VADIFLDTDDAATTAEKTICLENEQTQWNTNTESCANKCSAGQTPWWNSDASECQAPTLASVAQALETEEAVNTLNIFD